MTIELDHQTVTTTVTVLGNGADTFHDARRRVVREVDALLDGGWTGVAADSFATGWADWQGAAGDVLDSLVAMTRFLDAVHADLSERDTDAQASFDRAARQISARLG